jgi:hypothetical protein
MKRAQGAAQGVVRLMALGRVSMTQSVVAAPSSIEMVVPDLRSASLGRVLHESPDNQQIRTTHL